MKHLGGMALSVLALAIGLIGSGCEAKVPQRQFDDLNEAYMESEQRVAELTQDNQRLRSQLGEAQARIGQDTARDDLAELKAAIGDAGTVKMINGFPAVVLETDISFGSGQATLTANAQTALRRVVDLVRRRFPNAELAVAGHTDKQPIRVTRDRYKSNWELSAARALNTVHFLISAGIPPERVHAQAYGEFRSVVPETGTRGERRNRRVEIMLMGIR